MAGKKRCCNLAGSSAKRLGGALEGSIHSEGVTPAGGNQWSQKEKMRINTNPIQKVGREKVVKEAVTHALSNMLPRFFAARVPKKTPAMIEITDDTPSSRSVLTSLPD